MAERAPAFSSCTREVITSTESKSIYTSGDITEDVTIMHDGDALADCMVGFSKGGKLSAQAATLPRLVPVRFRLAPNTTILAQASGSSAAERAVLIIATQLTEESSMEEELFAIRCAMQQLAAAMTIIAQRMEIK